MKRFPRQLHFLQNIAGLLRPDVRLGRHVGLRHIRFNRGNQDIHAGKYAATACRRGRSSAERGKGLAIRMGEVLPYTK